MGGGEVDFIVSAVTDVGICKKINQDRIRLYNCVVYHTYEAIMDRFG